MLTMKLRLSFGLGLVVLARLVCAAQDLAHPSFCDIVQSPEKYDGERLSFRSHVESDGMHGAYLAEAGCAGSMAFDNEARADWTELNRIMDTVGTVGTARKSVEASWVGVVHVKGHVVSFSVERISAITYELSDTLRRDGR